jgi:hypothetical protein
MEKRKENNFACSHTKLSCTIFFIVAKLAARLAEGAALRHNSAWGRGGWGVIRENEFRYKFAEEVAMWLWYLIVK